MATKEKDRSDPTATPQNKLEILEAERILIKEEAEQRDREKAECAETAKKFDDFYRLIIEAREIWCDAHGDSEMMYETVRTLIDARDNFCKKKSENV
jgi:hypothetical protein